MLAFRPPLAYGTGKSAISAERTAISEIISQKNMDFSEAFPHKARSRELSGCGRLVFGDADGQDDLAVCLLPVAAGADACGADKVELMVNGI